MFRCLIHHHQGLQLSKFVICLNYQAVLYITFHKLPVTIHLKSFKDDYVKCLVSPWNMICICFWFICRCGRSLCAADMHVIFPIGICALLVPRRVQPCACRCGSKNLLNISHSYPSVIINIIVTTSLWKAMYNTAWWFRQMTNLVNCNPWWWCIKHRNMSLTDEWLNFNLF
jgi:hypothetical protein